MTESEKKLDDLQHKIDEARTRTGGVEDSTSEATAGSGAGMQMAVELFAGAVIGIGAGYYADRWLNSSPWCLIVGLFLGVAAGFRNLMRSSQNISGDR